MERHQCNRALCLSQFQLGTSLPPGNPRGFAQKNCPGGRDLTFESCPGGRDLTFESYPGAGNSTRAGVLWKVQTVLNAIRFVLKKRFVFLVFKQFSETPCMKVGLEVRISLVSVLSTGGASHPPPLPPKKKKIFLQKIKSYFKY